MRALLRVAAGLLVLAACVRSELDPEANVQLSGRVEGADGTGEGSVQVSLLRAEGNLCSAGLSAFASAQTDSDGRYAFSLRGADAQTEGRLARCFRVAPASAEDGSQAWAELLLQVTRPVVPPLPRWRWNLGAVSGTQGNVFFAFEDLRAVLGAGDSWLRVVDGAGLPAWELEAPAPGAPLDPAVLEDFPGLRAELLLNRVQDGQKTSVELTFRSAEVTLARGTRAAASRGAACSFGNAPGCPLTDGALARAPATADNLEVTLELPAAILPTDVVVRGLDVATGATRLEVSGITPEGASVPLGGLTAEEGLRPFERAQLSSAGLPVVAVTLRWFDHTGAGVPVTGLSEVSVFEAL